MFRQPVIITLAALTCVGGFRSVSADSLWRRRSPQHAYVFEDSRARRTGDLLTIIINESTEVDNSEDKTLRKSSDAQAVMNLAGNSGGGFGTGAASYNLDLGGNSSRNFNGRASYSNTRELADRITVKVVRVEPNGNLCVEGHRTIKIAGEARMLSISGVVRPIDIGPDNTVSSRFVANMFTEYEDGGAERTFTRQGWLGRAINWSWPF